MSLNPHLSTNHFEGTRLPELGGRKFSISRSLAWLQRDFWFWIFSQYSRYTSHDYDYFKPRICSYHWHSQRAKVEEITWNEWKWHSRTLKRPGESQAHSGCIVLVKICIWVLNYSTTYWSMSVGFDQNVQLKRVVSLKSLQWLSKRSCRRTPCDPGLLEI